MGGTRGRYPRRDPPRLIFRADIVTVPWNVLGGKADIHSADLDVRS
jgi:hypothetical protein